MNIRNSEHLQAEEDFILRGLCGPAAEVVFVSVSAQTAPAFVVLVAEDDFFVRSDIADFLRQSGYVVIEAASGEEAITLCESGMSIDIVFTDINLTGRVGGWEVAERCRADQPNIPVLYTSGKTIEPHRRVPGRSRCRRHRMPSSSRARQNRWRLFQDRSR